MTSTGKKVVFMPAIHKWCILSKCNIRLYAHHISSSAYVLFTSCFLLSVGEDKQDLQHIQHVHVQ